MNKYFYAGVQQHISRIQEFIPKLTPDLRKGQCGKIGIIGGSVEYSGAPYFSAIAALNLGADLVYVFCCREAAPVIKSYSPEIIVIPILDDTYGLKRFEPWLSRLHVLIIGPGLGYDAGVLNNVITIIKECNKITSLELPLIIDADGLNIVTENISLIQKYKCPVILTPNGNEYKRLTSKLSVSEPLAVAQTYNAVIVQKGLRDVITNGILHNDFNLNAKDVTIKCEFSGSNRRCGGQGDILTGCIATFVAWFILYKRKINLNSVSVVGKTQEEKLAWFNEHLMGFSWASYAGCMITKTCSKLAFEEYGRGMTASTMIPYIRKAFKNFFK